MAHPTHSRSALEPPSDPWAAPLTVGEDLALCHRAYFEAAEAGSWIYVLGRGWVYRGLKVAGDDPATRRLPPDARAAPRPPVVPRAPSTGPSSPPRRSAPSLAAPRPSPIRVGRAGVAAKDAPAAKAEAGEMARLLPSSPVHTQVGDFELHTSPAWERWRRHVARMARTGAAEVAKEADKDGAGTR